MDDDGMRWGTATAISLCFLFVLGFWLVGSLNSPHYPSKSKMWCDWHTCVLFRQPNTVGCTFMSYYLHIHTLLIPWYVVCCVEAIPLGGIAISWYVLDLSVYNWTSV